jgi:hypothetical protein
MQVRSRIDGAVRYPLDCDASATQAEVLEDKMSIEHARVAYGVVIGGGSGFPLEVDIAGTAGLRASQPKTK